ncbi:MAG: hypothetical protein ACI88Z_002083, partial [Sphingobacteriales bacterium]
CSSLKLGLRGKARFWMTNCFLKSSLAGSTELTTGFLVLFQRWKKNRNILQAKIYSLINHTTDFPRLAWDQGYMGITTITYTL